MIPKFRAWNKSTELMDEAILIDFYNEKIGILYADPISQGESVKTYSFDEVVLMQSTGLYDKNGKEIFEGDILTDEGIFENDCWDYANICFDKDYYTYRIVWKDEGIIESITNCSDYAIAGNIYETPELLEEVEE